MLKRDPQPQFKGESNYIYHPQTKFAKVMFLQVSVCPRRILRDAVNERAACILLECILVLIAFTSCMFLVIVLFVVLWIAVIQWNIKGEQHCIFLLHPHRLKRVNPHPTANGTNVLHIRHINIYAHNRIKNKYAFQ